MACRRLRVAVVDDFEVIVKGLARLLQPYEDRIEFVELVANAPVREDVDIALFDTFAQGEAHTDAVGPLLDNPHARNVVVYTWQFDDTVVARGLARGLRGYLSKALPGDVLVDALERIAAGEVVVAAGDAEDCHDVAGDCHEADDLRGWPARGHGLTEREAEVVALVATGRSNAEIADMLYVSENSIKTHIRSAYRKIGAESRTQAVLWAVDNGLRPEHRRVDDWRALSG